MSSCAASVEDDSAVLMLTAVPPSPRPVILPQPVPSSASTPRHGVCDQPSHTNPGEPAAQLRPLSDITNRVPNNTGLTQRPQPSHPNMVHAVSCCSNNRNMPL